MERAAGIAQQEGAEWAHGMAIHASTVAAIAAGLTAAAAHEAATAQVKGEVAAADEEARLTQEAIACKEAEMEALEEALAQERAKKEAEERAHAEATAKAQADAAKKDAIEAARRKVAEERAKTEAELAALEAEKARLQQTREAEAALAREEAERRAAAATAAAMEEAEAKLHRETPPGGSRVETLRKLFEGDPSSKMALDPEEVDTGSSGSSGPTAYRRRKGTGKTPERSRRPAGGHPHDSDPFFTASDVNEAADIAEEWLAEEAETSPWSWKVRMRVPLLPTEARSLPRPRRPGGATWTRMMTWTSTTRRSPHPRTHRDPLAEDHQDPLEDAHQVDPLEADHRAGEGPWTGRTRRRPSWRTPWGPQRPTRERRPGYHLAVDCLPPQEGPVPRARGRHGQGRDDSHRQGRRARTERAGHRQDRDGQKRQRRHRHPEAAGHRQERDQAAEQGHQRPAAEVGRAGRLWERRQRPPTPGVWLVGRRLGTRTRCRQTPRPRRSPQESPQRQCPLSQRPLSPQRGPPQRARDARKWQ